MWYRLKWGMIVVFVVFEVEGMKYIFEEDVFVLQVIILIRRVIKVCVMMMIVVVMMIIKVKVIKGKKKIGKNEVVFGFQMIKEDVLVVENYMEIEMESDVEELIFVKKICVKFKKEKKE